MNLNQVIVEFILILTKRGEKSDRFLSFGNQSVDFSIAGELILEIKEESILFLNKKELSKKILPVLPEKTFSHVDFAKLEKFCSKIDIVRLNHLGVSYVCEDPETEIERLKSLLVGTELKIYEEESDFPNQRWLFIGNLKKFDNPLFEFVLSRKLDASIAEWVPHFQIDIDTNQSIEELRELTSEFLRPNFFDWELDISDWGVVLGMGRIGNIGGTKICLGIGTNLRGTKKHREETLKEI